MPTYPHGFPHDVIDPFMNRTARGVLGNKVASGTDIIDELGEEHQQTGKWIVYTSADSVFQVAAHEQTIPLEELYEGCRVARELLTGKHAVGRVIARPFVGGPGEYERTPNRHDFSLEPKRPNYLSLVRDAGHKVYGVGKIGDVFAGCDIDESRPTKSNVDGINATIELLTTIESGLVFTNLVETDMLWGHRNDPVNFHRCLQDFDRRLGDILEALRPGDLLDPHLRSRLRPDDAVDRPLARACAPARLRGRAERGGTGARGRVRRRRRHRERLARRQGAHPRDSGHADPDSVNLNDPAVVAEEYASERGLVGRRDAYRYADGPDAPALAIEAVLEASPHRVLEVGCGPGEAAERIATNGIEVEALDSSERMVELARARGVEARVGDVQALPFEDESFDAALAAWMLYHVPDVKAGIGELARVLRPGGRLVAVTNRVEHLRELRDVLGGDFATASFSDENAREILLRFFTLVEERDAGGWINFPDRAAVAAYVDASRSLWARELPADFEGGLRVRRAPVIYIATKAG